MVPLFDRSLTFSYSKSTRDVDLAQSLPAAILWIHSPFSSTLPRGVSSSPRIGSMCGSAQMGSPEGSPCVRMCSTGISLLARVLAGACPLDPHMYESQPGLWRRLHVACCPNLLLFVQLTAAKTSKGLRIVVVLLLLFLFLHISQWFYFENGYGQNKQVEQLPLISGLSLLFVAVGHKEKCSSSYFGLIRSPKKLLYAFCHGFPTTLIMLHLGVLGSRPGPRTPGQQSLWLLGRSLGRYVARPHVLRAVSCPM